MYQGKSFVMYCGPIVNQSQWAFSFAGGRTPGDQVWISIRTGDRWCSYRVRDSAIANGVVTYPVAEADTVVIARQTPAESPYSAWRWGGKRHGEYPLSDFARQQAALADEYADTRARFYTGYCGG